MDATNIAGLVDAIVQQVLAGQMSFAQADAAAGVLQWDLDVRAATALQRELDVGRLAPFVYLDDLMKADTWERLGAARQALRDTLALMDAGKLLDPNAVTAAGREVAVMWSVFARIVAGTN